MGGKRKAADKDWQRDPFVLSPLDQQMAPSPTREIMFALLAKDRKTALTPGELIEQARNVRLLMGQIEFHLSQWKPGDERRPYGNVLSEIDRLIQRNNLTTRGIRDRAEQVIRERQYAALEAKIKAVPRFGAEHVDSAAASRAGGDKMPSAENG